MQYYTLIRILTASLCLAFVLLSAYKVDARCIISPITPLSDGHVQNVNTTINTTASVFEDAQATRGRFGSAVGRVFSRIAMSLSKWNIRAFFTRNMRRVRTLPGRARAYVSGFRHASTGAQYIYTIFTGIM